MLSLKLNALVLVSLYLTSLTLANLAELNSIFATPTFGARIADKACDRRATEPFQRHIVINNLDKALEIGLNKSFHDKFECLQRAFDDKLVAMQRFYKAQLRESSQQSQPTSISDTESASVPRKEKHRKKSKKPMTHHGHHSSSASFSHDFIGQTGFIFYSIDQNRSIADFKHESFTFVKPAVSNETDLSLLENEIAAFNSDMFVLKALMAQIKKNVKSRVSLLKAIRANERELKMENGKHNKNDKQPKAEENKVRTDSIFMEEKMTHKSKRHAKKSSQKSSKKKAFKNKRNDVI